MQISRKIHRILVLVISVLSLVMMTTGVMLKYQFVADFFQIDEGAMRYLHGSLSPFLSVVLFLMILTGMILYFVPLIVRSRIQK